MPEQPSDTAIQKANPTLQLQRPSTSFAPRTLDEAIIFCRFLANSELVPKDYRNKPENVLVAIQMGAELGIAPMQALSGIAVINGRGAVWGDLMLAIVMANSAYEFHKEWIEGEGAARKAHCQIKRKGQEVHEATFSMADATKAKLLDKDTPWKTYPDRMLQMRARGFALRDKFADALKGIVSVEEAMDYEVIDGGPLVEQPRTATPPPPPDPQEELIAMEEATAYWKTWKASGWTIEQAKAATKEIAGCESSKEIKRKFYAKCMEWAATKPAPAAPAAPAQQQPETQVNMDSEPAEGEVSQ